MKGREFPKECEQMISLLHSLHISVAGPPLSIKAQNLRKEIVRTGILPDALQPI